MTPHVIVNQTSQFFRLNGFFQFNSTEKFTIENNETYYSNFTPLVILQIDDMENVSSSLKITHYDCSSMQENKMYALNQGATYKVSPENLYLTDSLISVYQRSYRTLVNTVFCRVKTFPICSNSGLLAQSSSSTT